MSLTIRIALTASLLLAASVLSAADPQPQPPATPPAQTTAPAAPDLDINQAEIAAGVVPDALDPAKTAPTASEPSPLLVEIEAVLAASRAAVAELATRADATGDPAMAFALQQQIARVKQQAELDILAIQARHARLAGNDELATQIEADIATIMNPPAPVAPAVPRPAPADQH